MKRILKWLETKFSRHSAAVEADEPDTPVGVTVRVRVKPKDIAKEEYSVEVADDTITQRALGILDESSLDASESTGVDPYNSGSFDTSKMWKSRSRK